MFFSDDELQNFGKVAVLMGGESAERIISLDSGKAITTALCNVDIDAHEIDFDGSLLSRLIDDNFERVFIALHGRGGEDGTIQGALETIGLPYTGSGVLGSALAMDKIRSKLIWRSVGLSTPPSIELSATSEWDEIVEKLGSPIMVKPVREGSSLGASKVTNVKNLSLAWEHAKQFDERVMAESWIEGDEYTVPILNNIVLPVIKLETSRDFYDYKAKYQDKNTKYICPCGLDKMIEKNLGDLSLKACKYLDISGWARVDMIVDDENQAWLIEVNTVPGMTNHSLVPMGAKQAGLSFEQLVVQILATSLVMPVKVEL